MAEESDLERTEPASPRRLEKAREEGQVPQSRELSTFLVLMVGVGTLWLAGGWFAGQAAAIVRRGLTLERAAAFDPNAMVQGLAALAGEAMLLLAPLFVAVVIAALAGPLSLGGFNFSPKAFQPDFSRLDPLNGFSRVISMESLGELVKAMLKAVLVSGVAAWVIAAHRDDLFALLGQPLDTALAALGRTILASSLAIIAAMALIAGADVPFQLWQYHKRLRMTREEARQEHKELEGDPQLKARIRSQQREIARKRMMAEVPKADVVVTNPTHFSVALKYDAATMRAPRVVAKGRGEVALRIREIAAQAKVPLLEAPPLARALYRHAELGDEVPGALYTAVAEVLAYVYQLNHYLSHGGLPPRAPEQLSVPAELDPGVE
ncbi:MAG: flagellar biosynthesis protein FlhB [Pseudomonadota bacterium]